MKCESCQHWTIRRITTYGDMTVIDNWIAPSGKGHCESLGIETSADFGCNRFVDDGWDHVAIATKPGEPWQHWHMGPCPDCRGNGSHDVELRPACNRCAGTGNVRFYDDGHVGEERTRLHPKEIAAPPKCLSCGKVVDKEWKTCPWCAANLPVEAKTEVVDDSLAGLAPASPEATA